MTRAAVINHSDGQGLSVCQKGTMVIIHGSTRLGFEPVTVWPSAQVFNHWASPPTPETSLSTGENPTAGVLSTILILAGLCGFSELNGKGF